MANEAPQLFVAGFNVEVLTDTSYLLTIMYKDADGNFPGAPDRFSFNSAAKLLKFMKKNLLASGGDEATEVSQES